MSRPLIVLMRIWLGELPPWYISFMRHMATLEQFEIVFVGITSEKIVRDRFRSKLGIEIDPQPGTRKASDYCPALGYVFDDIVGGADYWGHADMDVLFGRIDHFLTPELLDRVDVWGGDPDAICGPLSVYRNCVPVNELFMQGEGWQHAMQTGRHLGYDEIGFTETVRRAAVDGDVRFESGYHWAHDHQLPEARITRGDDGALFDRGREIIGYHFNQTRKWPDLI